MIEIVVYRKEALRYLDEWALIATCSVFGNMLFFSLETRDSYLSLAVIISNSQTSPQPNEHILGNAKVLLHLVEYQLVLTHGRGLATSKMSDSVKTL